MREAQLDISQVSVSDQGIKDFAWPLPRSDFETMRDTLLLQLAQAAQQFYHTHQPEQAELLALLNGLFINEVMAVYQAHSLDRRFGQIGKRPVGLRPHRLLPAITRKTQPPMFTLYQLLVNLPTHDRAWIPPTTRRIYRSIQLNGWSPAILVPPNSKSDIIALQVYPLLLDHAAGVSGRVSYSPLPDWFSYPNHINPSTTYAANAPCVDHAIKAVQLAFQAGRECLPDYLASHLRAWLSQAVGLVSAHIDALIAHHNQLPKQLWTGSGGNIWGRILRAAVKRTGGEVVGHDHAPGVGHLCYPVKFVTEYIACDRFYTFTPAQAEGLRLSFRKELLFQDKPPEILVVQRSANTQLRQAQIAPRSTASPNKVMHMSSFYNGERAHFAIQVPDVVQIDWEARLFTNLKKRQYHVFHKPHPGSLNKPPAAFVEEFGVHLLNEPFEKVLDQAEVFIFSWPQSTTFPTALKHRCAIVFIDFGFFCWNPAAFDLLKRRCRVVEGWIDEANRLQVDWDDLNCAIAEAAEYNDPGFYESYIGTFGK